MKYPSHSTLGYSAAALLATSGAAFSAGFQIVERSASGLGRAYSGEAAIVDNASAIGSNPASAAYFDTTSVSVAVHAILVDFDATGTINGALPADADLKETLLVPAVYVAGPINERLGYGIGLNAPYGLVTDYPSDFAGTFIADKSDLATISFNPNLAYRINNNLTLAAGINVVHAEATLTSTSMGARILDLEGDTTEFGVVLGAMIDLSDQTRVGLSYRGAVDMTLDGDVVSDVVAPFNGPATADLELPPTFEISINHDVCDALSVHADATWTGWSTFEELAPVLDTGVPIPPTPENWDDVMRFAVGATYKQSDQLTLRAGLAWDESPVPDEFRTLRIPDEDRFWIAVGATYQINEQISADLGYTHIIVEDASLSDGNESGVFDGSVEGHINIIGLQVNYAF